jgi:hypothetical protein
MNNVYTLARAPGGQMQGAATRLWETNSAVHPFSFL